MKNLTKPFVVGVLGTIAALGVAVTTTPKAEAGGIYWNNNGGGGVVVNRGYYYGSRPGYYNHAPRYYAPYTTTVKHNKNTDTVKVCREYYYGAKNCEKWRY